MDPITILASVGVSGAITLISELMAQGRENEARALMDEAQRQVDAVALPEFQKAVVEQIGPTAFETITVDPALRQAQLGALTKLGQIAEEGGMTLADKAALNRITGQLSRRDAAARQAIMENMAARGTLGSGAELAQRLSAQQESSQLASERGLDVAAQAQQRALNAIMQRGQLGGSIRAQEYAEAANRAQAQDAIARYNAEARQRAQAYNLGIPLAKYQTEMERAKARAGIRAGNIQGEYAAGQGIRAAGAGYGAAAGKLAGALAGADWRGEDTGTPSGGQPRGYSLDESLQPTKKSRIGSYTTAGGNDWY